MLRGIVATDSSVCVSVCVPTFNAGHLLADSVGSAIRQTYRNLEILVSDNASTDDTSVVASAFSSQDPRVRYLRHRKNIGMVGNFNACLEQARGEYVKFVCADDALEPECVEQMVGVMLAHPEVSLVACARQLVDDNHGRIGLARYSKQLIFTDGAAAIRRCFFHGNLIGEPTAVMFRRGNECRRFDNHYRQLVDLEMWFHFLRRGAFAFLPDPLCRVRKHGKQATVENLASGAVLEDKRRLFREFGADAGRRGSLKEKVLWDARMAVTVYRTRSAGGGVMPKTISEVFFPRVFPRVTCAIVPWFWRLFSQDSKPGSGTGF